MGSLLSYSSNRQYDRVYRSRPAIRGGEVVYVNRTTASPSSTAVASGRRLLRDIEGNCFERVIDAEGNEIRAQIEASECDF